MNNLAGKSCGMHAAAMSGPSAWMAGPWLTHMCGTIKSWRLENCGSRCNRCGTRYGRLELQIDHPRAPGRNDPAALCDHQPC